jgi:hypothetical protein
MSDGGQAFRVGLDGAVDRIPVKGEDNGGMGRGRF